MAEPGDPTLIDRGRVPVALGLAEARAMARDRFRTRLLAGEPVGGCSCHDEEARAAEATDGSAERVVGVRFRDSGRTYYFRVGDEEYAVGEWVVAETGRGREAGRVVIAPHQIARNSLEGSLTPILRRMSAEDVERMDALKRDSAKAVRACAALARERRLPIKVVSADYAFDGSALTLNYSVPQRERTPETGAMRAFVREAANALGCRVETRQVGPRDEARLLGGLGRCGRTLCCSSWLPVFPEISMNMAKTQDLPLNPSKVSGVCGRLLCCLSFENEQYKQMKAIMPRLGQPVESPDGPGIVVAMQLLREQVTVRLDADGTERAFAPADLGIGGPAQARRQEAAPPLGNGETAPEGGAAGEMTAEEANGQSRGRRRRRRRSGAAQPAEGSGA